jgi:SAM-dependent methyltransferase
MVTISEVQDNGVGLVVPLFNEADRFGDFGKLLLDFTATLPPGSELVFVDDGSDDSTPELVDELLASNPAPARLLRQPHIGKGAAVAAGLRSTTARYAAFCDVDLSTPLDQLARIIDAARRAEVLAIGSRDVLGSRRLRRQSQTRQLLGRAYNRLLQLTVVPGVVDTQCGAKAASRRVWEQILPWCHEVGYAWDAEIVAVALATGVQVQEVAIDWRHDERSKIRVGRDGLAMLRATPRLRRSATVAARDRLAPAMSVFDDGNAAMLEGSDRSHWWFRSKAALVATALDRTATQRRTDGWLVDLGGGSGGVTALLGWVPERTVVVEGNASLARAAHARGLVSVQASVERVPLVAAAADVVCLLDVIEHLADPIPALREAAGLLRSDGRLVVNVPAHRWLWSEADTQLGHHRRYTRRTLRDDLGAAGLQPILLTHVFCWLVPPVWVVRRLRRPSTPELGLDRTSLLVDRAAIVLTTLERLLVGRIGLPLGTSVLCVAERGPSDGVSHRRAGEG